MELARKENKKYTKKLGSKTNKNVSKEPIWFSQEIEKEEMSKEDLEELEDLFKDYR